MLPIHTAPPANPWLNFQHVFVNANQMPFALRRKFWESPLDYRDRLYFAALGLHNGISCQFLLDVLQFTNPNYTFTRASEIKGVYVHLEELPLTHLYCNYYAFHFFERRVFMFK